jgi:FR47-like protein
MGHLKVTFKPNINHIEEIKAWLIEEEQYSGTGFYCNWESIYHSFENKKIAVLIRNKSAVGFMTWFDREKVTTIQIAEINSACRRMGYAKFLTKVVSDKLCKRGACVLELHCQPASSEKVWKKLGFLRFPDVDGFKGHNSEHGRRLYKILIPHLKPTKSILLDDFIELWPVEPHLAQKVPSGWCWKIRFIKHSSYLSNPIIFPAKRDWNLRRTNNDNILNDDKVKYFQRGDEIDFGDFIIIERLDK